MDYPIDEKTEEQLDEVKVDEVLGEQDVVELEADDDEEFVLQSVSSDVEGEELSDEGDEEAEEQEEAPHVHRPIDDMRLEAKIEAMIFASHSPVKITEIETVLDDESVTLEDIQEVLNALVEFYDDRCGGFKLKYIKRQGYQFWSADEAGPIMERMFASRPRPISRAALETLSIVAYRQPVTRAEVEFIRGVDVGSIFKGLVERNLVKCVGRKDVVGRPMLFGTTDEFLAVFQLQSLKDLPPLEAFQPAPDMVAGAVERLEDGVDDIDVEQYISSNMDEDSIEELNEEVAEQLSEEPVEMVEEDATEEIEAVVEETMPEESIDEPVRLEGATAFDETFQKIEQDNDYDAPTEMDISIGDSLEKGSGELDH